ncbi:hypothetical protein MMC13_008344 [Lambiella insularis]|nr:hypothetical protein [Lambiella insularis]
MVDIMQELWKGMLVEDPGEACAVLPSPIALKRMLVVKVAKSVDSNVTSLGSTLKVHSAASQSDSQDEVSNNTAKAKAKGKKHIVIQALSALGVYAHSYHFRNLSSLEARIPTHVFSLSERKFMQVHETQGDDLFSHNRNYLMRTYPGYQRVSSSNLDPAFFWRKGVQMVALNWQSLDAGMMLNEGMFGGASGWILKPEGYRRLHAVPGSSPKDNLADSMPHKILNLTIEVFAAQDLPLPLGEIRPNHYQPYVKCELHIEKAEERSGDPIAGGGRSRDGEHKRTTKASKGIEPDFGGVLMDFTGIADVVEELSFVRFKIEDDCVGKDRLGAWACIRLDRLRDGLRFVHLFDARGIESRGILLIKTSKTTA